MRQITEIATEKFMYDTNTEWRQGNTDTKIRNGYIELRLHENTIARRKDGTLNIEITNAGWFSNTTKERLNGLPGVSIQQKKGVWFLNGKEWDGKWIMV